MMNVAGRIHLNKMTCCFLCLCVMFVFFYTNANENVQWAKTSNQINLRKLLAVAIMAAEDGGRVVVATKNDIKVDSKGLTIEGANDTVTNADIKSHCVMTTVLARNYPQLTVISEEAKAPCEDDGRRDFNASDVVEVHIRDEFVDIEDLKVWIDPLDATQEYTENLDLYVTTMVCIAYKGQPLIGVIHKPFFGDTMWAWIGKTRSLNLKEPKDKDENKVTFITSRSHKGDVKELIREKFKDENYEIISAGGAGYKVLELARGTADAYVHATVIKKWDICAGNVIVNSLGGKMTTRHGVEVDFSNSDDVVNKDGLIVALKNYNKYFDALSLKE